MTSVTRNGQVLIPNVTVVPDLVRATIDVQHETAFLSETWILTATVTFASGTWSRTDSAFCFLLDADENPGTGNPGIGSDARSFGWDYALCAADPRAASAVVYQALRPSQPGLLQLLPSPGTIGSVPDGPLGPVEERGGVGVDFPAAGDASRSGGIQ